MQNMMDDGQTPQLTNGPSLEADNCFLRANETAQDVARYEEDVTLDRHNS